MTPPMNAATPRRDMERLPVNPRRNKIPPEARKRVSQACNSCNVRRAKCSGGQPCERCLKASRDCVYPQIEEMVSVRRRHYDDLQQKCLLLEKCLAEVLPSYREREKLMQYLQSQDCSREITLSGSDQDLVDESQSHNEGRILQDPDGRVRYLGESSGATFLNHLREYMATAFPLTSESAGSSGLDQHTAFIADLGKYQTHDSRPLLTTNVNPLMLPSKDQATAMISELQHSAQDGEGTFPSGGMYYWADPKMLFDDYQSYVEGRGSTEIGPNVITANAAFAVACQFNPACAPEWEADFGRTFFARSRSLTGNPLDASSINDAVVLALLGFYLLNNNRRDAAYIYISIAMHILIVHGVHRAWMVDEPGKRLFWTVYILDRWLSCLMGRPALISDDSIKLDLPRDASGLPAAAGLRAHIELARISNYIVSNVYDVAKQRGEPLRTTLCIHKSLRLLQTWRENLPATVRYHEDIFRHDRAACELHMSQNQLVILAIRPLLFIAVKRATASILLNGHASAPEVIHKDELDACADAARRNIYLWHCLLSLHRPAMLSHFSIHYLFNAALTLQLYGTLADNLSEFDLEEISFTVSALSMDKGSNMEYAKDCSKVLSDLGSLVIRLRNADALRSSSDNVQRLPPSQLHGSIMSPNSDVTSTTGLSDGANISQPISEAGSLRHDGAKTVLFSHRETAYNELLSWLETDELQRRIDFPSRFDYNTL